MSPSPSLAHFDPPINKRCFCHKSLGAFEVNQTLVRQTCRVTLVRPPTLHSPGGPLPGFDEGKKLVPPLPLCFDAATVGE